MLAVIFHIKLKFLLTCCRYLVNWDGRGKINFNQATYESYWITAKMTRLMNKKASKLDELNDEIEMVQKDVTGLNGKMSSIQKDVNDLDTQVSK